MMGQKIRICVVRDNGWPGKITVAAGHSTEQKSFYAAEEEHEDCGLSVHETFWIEAELPDPEERAIQGAVVE